MHWCAGLPNPTIPAIPLCVKPRPDPLTLACDMVRQINWLSTNCPMRVQHGFVFRHRFIRYFARVKKNQGIKNRSCPLDSKNRMKSGVAPPKKRYVQRTLLACDTGPAMRPCATCPLVHGTRKTSKHAASEGSKRSCFPGQTIGRRPACLASPRLSAFLCASLT